MTTAACLILALLATSITNGASKTVQELTSRNIRTRPNGPPLSQDDEILTVKGRKVALLSNIEGLDVQDMMLNHLTDVELMHIEDSGRSSSCITHEQCIKKKVICYKKCLGSSENDVEKKHLPGGKCTVHCKKCVPTC